MKTSHLLLLVGSCVGLAASQGSLQLPAGAELLLGPIRTTFECPMRYGYYADADNDCRVFHVCNPVQKGDRVRMEKYSFICGNLTVFDQLSQTCTFAENAIPCGNAAEFFYLNERIGVEKAFFHEDEDINRAAKLVPLYGRYADSPTPNGRPGGKPLGFKGKAFFTNRDRKPAQSVREDLNVTRINKAKNNRLYVPLEGGLLNVHKNPQTLSPIGKKSPIGKAGRRRSSTPSFGTLPGYGNRLNLDVINFRDNDFKVRRLQLAAGQKAQLAPGPVGVKFVTSQERRAEESAPRQLGIDDGHSRTTASGKERASVPHDSERSDDKPSAAEAIDKVRPVSTTTPATTSESATQKADIETFKTADDTKTRAALATQKSDVNKMPNSAGIIKSSNEEETKAEPKSKGANAPEAIKTPAKSTASKKSISKTSSEARKASKKVEPGSGRDEKMKKTVSPKVNAPGAAGKQNSKSTATAPSKSMAPATTTTAPPPTSRKQKKVRTTAAPTEDTVAPTTLTTAQPTSTTPPTKASTASRKIRTSSAEPMSTTTSQPSTTTSDITAEQPTMQVSTTESTERREVSTATGTTTTLKPLGKESKTSQTLRVESSSSTETPKPVGEGSKTSQALKPESSSSTETPESQSTDSPMIVVTIPPLPAVTSSTVTESELNGA